MTIENLRKLLYKVAPCYAVRQNRGVKNRHREVVCVQEGLAEREGFGPTVHIDNLS
jgi:hypothetical protein